MGSAAVVWYAGLSSASLCLHKVRPNMISASHDAAEIDERVSFIKVISSSPGGLVGIELNSRAMITRALRTRFILTIMLPFDRSIATVYGRTQPGVVSIIQISAQQTHTDPLMRLAHDSKNRKRNKVSRASSSLRCRHHPEQNKHKREETKCRKVM